MKCTVLAAIVAVWIPLSSPAQSDRPASQPQSPPEARSPHGSRRNVAVLVFDGVELLDFSGPVEAFSQANGWDAPFRIYTVAAEKGAIRTNNVVTVVPDFAVGDCPQPNVLVIPGGEVACLDGDRPLGRFIREQAPKAEIVFSVCNGAFSLAHAGLLDGLEATTHWTAIGWLREAAPKTTIREDRRVVDNGHIVTAAGVSAGIDGALHLVERMLGPRVAQKAARRMEYTWTGGAAESPPPSDRVERARLAWYAEDWKAGAEEYRAIVAERPGDAVAWTRLGTCLLFTRRNDEAIEALERVVPLGSSDARFYEALGLARGRAGRHASAVESLSRARELDPASTGAVLFLGMEQVEAGLRREAIPNLQHALQLGVGDARARAQLAKAQIATGDSAGALASLAQAPASGHAELERLLADPAFDAVRGDARFPKSAEKQQASRPAPSGESSMPSVSPDGRHVAFSSNRGDGDDLYVVADDGSGERRLTRTPEHEGRVAWTDGGARLVFSTFAGGMGTLVSIAADGTDPKTLATVPGRNPALLPGGATVVFSTGDWKDMQISAAGLGGSGARRLSDGTGAIWNVAVSPDGKQLAYTRSVVGDMQVWLMNADGSAARPLTRFPAEDGRPQMPAWSADGRRIAVQANREDPRDKSRHWSHIWVVDVESGAATKLARHDEAYLDESPSWFPDGKRIAFQSNRTGRMEIWVMNADGGGMRQLTGLPR